MWCPAGAFNTKPSRAERGEASLGSARAIPDWDRGYVALEDIWAPCIVLKTLLDGGTYSRLNPAFPWATCASSVHLPGIAATDAAYFGPAPSMSRRVAAIWTGPGVLPRPLYRGLRDLSRFLIRPGRLCPTERSSIGPVPALAGRRSPDNGQPRLEH